MRRYLCDAIVADPDENLCHGCGRVICDAHEAIPWGQHEPEAHDDEESGDDGR